MRFIRSLFSRLFHQQTVWDSLPYPEPAASEDELARLNNER
jgi:hypothetical protein